MHAAPSRTEVVNLLLGQLPRGELHFYTMDGALRGPGHNWPIINLLSYRNVAREQVANFSRLGPFGWNSAQCQDYALYPPILSSSSGQSL